MRAGLDHELNALQPADVQALALATYEVAWARPVLVADADVPTVELTGDPSAALRVSSVYEVMGRPLPSGALQAHETCFCPPVPIGTPGVAGPPTQEPAPAPLHIHPDATAVQVDRQPLSVLVESSHTSPVSITPLPQFLQVLASPAPASEHDHPDELSTTHASLHPSRLSVLPSSHASDPALLPSPHVVEQTDGDAPSQVHPYSTLHALLHPSPDEESPSSQASDEAFVPSPHPASHVSLPPELEHE